ncbi:MAG TPA: protein kinase [Planctomycetota bacterium]|jgi:serine/threonine-protein kinase
MAEVTKIGNYDQLERIGQGGMGAVFKARQISMERTVALKILPPTLARQPKFIERFVREARASARLNHPNIVNGIDVGQDKTTGYYYFAMEYVQGEDLRQIIARGPVPEARVIEIGKGIASALAHAHANGILHRDIKPDNILIDKHQTPKLCDLGLARLDSEDEAQKHLTQQGQAVGTPHYISPEQARGQRDVDAKADLYSLGATLYHAVCGKPMFEGTTSVVVMTKHIMEKAPNPGDRGVTVSRTFVAVLAKLLVKDRNERYASAQELVEDLTRLQQGKAPLHADLPPGRWPFTGGSPSVAAPKKASTTSVVVEKSRHSRKESKREHNNNRVWVGVGAGLAVLIVAASVVLALRNRQAASPDSVVDAQPSVPEVSPSKPAPTPVSMPRVAPPSEVVGFKKPVDPLPRVAPPSQAAGFKTPIVMAKPNPEADHKAETKAAAVTPEPEKKAAPLPPKVDPAKILPSAEVAGWVTKAAALGAETKYRDALALFQPGAEKLKSLDAFDQECVKLHADAYGNLVEMKQKILDQLNAGTAKVESSTITKEKTFATGTLSGGNEARIDINIKGNVLGYNWSRLGLEDIQSLIAAVFGPNCTTYNLGLGLLTLDRADDATARKLLASANHPMAKRLLELTDKRDEGLLAKKTAERRICAEKLLADCRLMMGMADPSYPKLLDAAKKLKDGYADTDVVKEKAEEISEFLMIGRLGLDTGAGMAPGNVALASNGTTISGGTGVATVIDGITTGYTGSTGFGYVPPKGEMLITMPKVYLLREIRLLLWDTEPERYYQYIIEGSTDGQAFTVLSNRSKGRWRSWQTIKLPTPKPVKVIKFKGVYCSAEGAVHVVELEAYCRPPEKPAIPKQPSVPPGADDN